MRDVQVDLPEHDEGTEHDQGRHSRVASPPQRAGQDLIKAQHQVKGRDDPEKTDAVRHDLFLGGEEAEQLAREDQHRRTEYRRREKAHAQRCSHALAGTFAVFCAPVLTDKGRGGHADRLHGDQHEGVQLIVDPISRHAGGAEGVDIGLYVHVGKRSYRRLDARRQTDFQDAGERRAVDLQIAPADAVRAALAAQCDQDE